MDIKIKNKKEHFKMRVSGCLIKDNKILMVQICNNGFYCLPGGHVHIGETSEDAVRREFFEEVKINTRSIKLFCLNENFFEDKQGDTVHEICFYYLLDGEIETRDFSYVENDNGKLVDLHFKWINLDQLDEYDCRPRILLEKFKNKQFDFEHIVFNQLKK